MPMAAARTMEAAERTRARSTDEGRDNQRRGSSTGRDRKTEKQKRHKHRDHGAS